MAQTVKRTCLQCGRPRFHPWVRKIPWRREWQPTPVFLPDESHGQRSLAGYSPWGQKESRLAWATSAFTFNRKWNDLYSVWTAECCFSEKAQPPLELCNMEPLMGGACRHSKQPLSKLHIQSPHSLLVYISHCVRESKGHWTCLWTFPL